jgi:hypothetical protein
MLQESHSFPGEYEVWNDIYDGTINCDIAIYGSSRAWVQLDPKIIETAINKKVYNFGIDGHNFRLQYLRHLEYLKFNKKSQHIILIVDVFTLEKRGGLYQQEQFLPYMLWNQNIRTYTSNYQGFSTSDYYVPFLRYMGRNHSFEQVSTHIFNSDADTVLFRNNGYRGFDLAWDTKVDTLLASGEKYKINFHKPTITLFEQFLNECLKNNIPVTLVYAPEYIEGQKFVSNREEAMIYYRDVSQKYNLTFLDYSKDDLSFRKDQFYNASHLNKEGSQRFTRKVVKDLQESGIVEALEY